MWQCSIIDASISSALPRCSPACRQPPPRAPLHNPRGPQHRPIRRPHTPHADLREGLGLGLGLGVRVNLAPLTHVRPQHRPIRRPHAPHADLRETMCGGFWSEALGVIHLNLRHEYDSTLGLDHNQPHRFYSHYIRTYRWTHTPTRPSGCAHTIVSTHG